LWRSTSPQSQQKLAWQHLQCPRPQWRMFDCCLVVMNTQRLHFGHGFCSSVTSKRAAVTDAVAGSVTEGDGAFCVFICRTPGAGCGTPLGFWNGTELYRVPNVNRFRDEFEFPIVGAPFVCTLLSNLASALLHIGYTLLCGQVTDMSQESSTAYLAKHEPRS
jgi:hypothetical protein